MKTFISDLIPKLQRFSQKLDNLTLLTNQHWVVIDDISVNKNVYIFQANNNLLISKNGKVEKAKWEYLGNNSLLIDKKNESYLFKHGFFDENILALKIDSKDEYAFLINENKYDGELNSIEKVIDFLKKKYIVPDLIQSNVKTTEIIVKTNKQVSENSTSLITIRDIEIEVPKKYNLYIIDKGQRVFFNGKKAPNGKYKIGFMEYIIVLNGIIVEKSFF